MNSKEQNRQSHIRNFCIIAHIDHGKSTLADRLLEITGTVEKREMKNQLLDRMDLEREKGITIKLQPVRMDYKGFQLNLIDTPGHVDFSYEVSRSLEACEGAILVVDATQGIQAQTLANVYLAMAADLTIIPVLNKIDLPAADVERVSAEVMSLLGCSKEDILHISAKTGDGVPAVLDAVVEQIPSPNKGGLYKRVHPQTVNLSDEQGADEQQSESYIEYDERAAQSATKLSAKSISKPTGSASGQAGTLDGLCRALIFDSYYDDYRGVILYVRAVDGVIRRSSEIKMMATDAEGIALEVGALKPDMSALSEIATGEIGYIVTNLKSTREAKVGDTVTLTKNEAAQALPGYKDVKPFVYAGFFPASNEYYNVLKDAVEKLSLSDSALQFSPENSPVLGFGMRIGFLGLLHMEIIKERLEREYNLDLIITNPSTDYHVVLMDGEEIDIRSASDLPDVSKVAEIREPWIVGEVVVPKDYVGSVIQLVSSKRGIQKNISYVDELSVVTFEAPLANLLTDFYDQLKTVTSGYGSFNYELADYRAQDLVKLDFYVAGDMVEALSIMVHRTEAQSLGRDVVAKLKEVIPRQQFKVALQAAIGGKFIAREDVSSFRKDVTQKLYGGDVTRRKKLLEKQKKGKARMKRFGQVDIPAEAFTVLLKRD
jgi:GTP-binding protein LepA